MLKRFSIPLFLLLLFFAQAPATETIADGGYQADRLQAVNDQNGVYPGESTPDNSYPVGLYLSESTPDSFYQNGIYQDGVYTGESGGLFDRAPVLQLVYCAETRGEYLPCGT